MNTIFVNSGTSRTSDTHRLNKDKYKDKINKYIASSNLSIYLHGKMLKKPIITINSKFWLQHGMKYLTYLMDHILYHIFKIYVNKYMSLKYM